MSRAPAQTRTEARTQARAIRGAEIGDSTVETRTIPQTLQAMELLTEADDLLAMFCDCIVKNKSIGIYDGAYKSVELATGRKFSR
mgnify:CR=1 FL=1